MKSSIKVKATLICQGFRFSSDLHVGAAFVQSDLCIAILFNKHETLAVKSSDQFLLVGDY